MIPRDLQYVADRTFDYTTGSNKATFVWGGEVVVLYLTGEQSPEHWIISSHKPKALEQIKEYLTERFRSKDEDSMQDRG